MGIVRHSTNGIGVVIGDNPFNSPGFLLNDVFVTNRWYHIALVSGPGGMRLFLNGVLIGAHAYTGSFAALGNNDTNELGHKNEGTPAITDTVGLMDDLRVWNVERTEEEIRENMNRRLTGTEPGLAGWWNFDDPQMPMRDFSTNGHHGRLIGEATSIPAALPRILARSSLQSRPPGPTVSCRHST